MCSELGSPGSRSQRTYETWRVAHENIDGKVYESSLVPALMRAPQKAEPFLFSAADSPARTCPSPDDAQDSPGNDQDSSMSSPGSQTLFDPDGYSSRTYPDCSPRMAVGTSESLLERWPTSGTAWPGGFSTHVSSECRSDAEGCSSSEPALTETLEPPPNVPEKYSLSARAATGILRRAEKRGRTLPSHLQSALSRVAGSADTGSTPKPQQEGI
jgi:hypothetical protein